MHALANEILKDRRAVKLLAKAIGWADTGAPFALIAPVPRWRPRRTGDANVAPRYIAGMIQLYAEIADQ